VQSQPTGDLVETTRDRPLVLDPDLTVRFADRSFGDAFTVTPKDTLREGGPTMKRKVKLPFDPKVFLSR
jgi:hypothetical protein